MFSTFMPRRDGLRRLPGVMPLTTSRLRSFLWTIVIVIVVIVVVTVIVIVVSIVITIIVTITMTITTIMTITTERSLDWCGLRSELCRLS